MASSTELTTSARAIHRQRAQRRVRRVALAARYLSLSVVALIFALPFLWMVLTSLKTPKAVFLVPPALLPLPPQWGNYLAALTEIPFLLYLANTTVIAASGTVGAMICGAFVGYSLSLVDWPGRRWLFPVVIVSMMLPFQAKMVPTFLIFTWLHWTGSFLPLIVPSFVDVPLFIFLMRQFYLTLPPALVDAGRVDGANEWIVFWRVVLPLTKPALASVAIFAFLGHWHEFLLPLIYLTSPSSFTLSIGLQVFQTDHTTEWALLMAATTVFTLPVVVLFFSLQRFFVQGIAVSGLKG